MLLLLSLSVLFAVVVVVCSCLKLSLCVLAVILSAAKDPEGADITQALKPFSTTNRRCFPQKPSKKLLSSPQIPYLSEDKQDARGILTPSNRLNLKQERKKQLLSSSKQHPQNKPGPKSRLKSFLSNTLHT
jgi:hypothetical protein